MATVKKLIGRLPVYKGDWVAGSYAMLNQVTYLGSTFQSKIDNNTSQPATVVNNALQVNANWSIVSNGTAAYLADSRLTVVEDKANKLESGVATKADQSEVDRLEQGIDAKIATKANQSDLNKVATNTGALTNRVVALEQGVSNIPATTSAADITYTNLVSNSIVTITGAGIVHPTGIFSQSSSYKCVIIPVDKATAYSLKVITSKSIVRDGWRFGYLKKTGTGNTFNDFAQLTAQEIEVANLSQLYIKKSNTVINTPTIPEQLYICLSEWVVDNVNISASNTYLIKGVVDLPYTPYNSVVHSLLLNGTYYNIADFSNNSDKRSQLSNSMTDLIKSNSIVSRTRQLIDINKINTGKGIIYYTNVYGSDDRYDSVEVHVINGESYTVSGLSRYVSDGVAGGLNCAIMYSDYSLIDQSDIIDFSNWIANSGFRRIASGCISSELSKVNSKVLMMPRLASGKSIILVVNTRFDTIDIKNEIMLNVGSQTYPYESYEIIRSLYNYGFGSSSQSSQSSSRYAGKTILTAGDSITQGTEGGYQKYIEEITGAITINKGSSGANSGRLVGILTEIKDRDANSPVSNIDYANIHAVTIMIGINGGVSGTLTDIPTISIYDVESAIASGSPLTYDGILIDSYIKYFYLFKNTYYGNVALCIEWLQWKNNKMDIYLITTPQCPSRPTFPEPLRVAIYELSKKYAVEVIDAYTESRINLKTGKVYYYDGLHFNSLGNEVFGEFVGNKLR